MVGGEIGICDGSGDDIGVGCGVLDCIGDGVVNVIVEWLNCGGVI